MTKEWGLAHSIFHEDLYWELVKNQNQQILFHGPIEWDGRGLFFAKISSPHLPPGYHGQQDIIFENGKIRFRVDCDV